VNTHKNARTNEHSRLLLVERVTKEGWTVANAAEAAGISKRTAFKWLARFKEGGRKALADRSHAPRHVPHKLSNETVEAIKRLRLQRMTGPAIARTLNLPRSTVGAVLRRLGLGKLKALEEKPPARRYQRERPGELIHYDTKKLGRINGIGHPGRLLPTGHIRLPTKLSAHHWRPHRPVEQTRHRLGGLACGHR